MLVFDQTTWEQRLLAKPRLSLRPERAIAVKRDVRNFVVSVAAPAFVSAFETVMADTERRFGGIRILRPEARMGKPFVVGERFQGCFSLEAFMPQIASSGAPLSRAASWRSGLGPVVRTLEDVLTSDYGEVVELRTCSLPACLRYVYLEGSAMAGSSMFEVSALSVDRCLVRQTWEYQELWPHLLLLFGTVVLRTHLRVVDAQVQQAARLAGGAVLESDIPAEYCEPPRPRPQTCPDGKS